MQQNQDFYVMRFINSVNSDAKFHKNKKTAKVEITLSITDLGKSCPSRKFFNLASMSFNAIRKNKILVKISQFTVL